MSINMKRNFRCFARNERWGTCGECPFSDNEIYPEFCKNTTRYDHQLTIDSLVEQYKIKNERNS